MPTANDSSTTSGVTRSATCAADETAISDGSRYFPREAITTAPPCSAALPTIATITAAVKNVESPTASANALSEWTRISLTSAVTTVAAASTASDDRRVQSDCATWPDSAWRRLCRRSPCTVTAT